VNIRKGLHLHLRLSISRAGSTLSLEGEHSEPIM